MIQVSDYIVQKLIECGITDVFGGTGSVIIDLIDAFRLNKNKIKAHLNYHEQASSFSANGYAKVGGPFGVAFATKGPGFLNLLSGVASAFYDSVPVLFIVGHYLAGEVPPHPLRKQEMNTTEIVKSFVKYSVRIEKTSEFRYEFEKVIYLLSNGRPGPVLLDINAKVFSSKFEPLNEKDFIVPIVGDNTNNFVKVTETLERLLTDAERPVMLLGDGVHQAKQEQETLMLVEKLQIPVLSSRHSQDIAKTSEYYYGFIGSNGVRYANIILERADLIISIGNRLAIREDSRSFGNFFADKKLVRFEIDKTELQRKFVNEISFNVDLRTFLSCLVRYNFAFSEKTKWLEQCESAKMKLHEYDLTEPDNVLCAIFDRIKNCSAIVSDIGKNERWTAVGYFQSRNCARFLYTNGFGVVGNALYTAIGAHYVSQRRTIACIGDAGLQASMTELQFIARENIPVTVVIQNNLSAGLIKDIQHRKFNGNFYLTTGDSGYSPSNYEAIAKAYNIHYEVVKNIRDIEKINFDKIDNKPLIIEVVIDSDLQNIPNLPIGNSLSRMTPELPEDIFLSLNI